MGTEEPVPTSVFTEASDDNLGVGMGAEEPIPISGFIEDSDHDEPIIRFKRTVKTTPQPLLKPSLKHQRKTTTTPNASLNTLPYQHQIQSSGPAPVLPLPKDTIDSPAKKNKTVRRTSLQTTLKTR